MAKLRTQNDRSGSVRDGSAMSVNESSEAEMTEQVNTGAGASEARVPTWVWVVLGALGVALVAVTLGLFVQARDASTNANDASVAASQGLDRLVADVKTTNDELNTFNQQFESAMTSAQTAASSAQEKQKQSKRSSSNNESP